MSKAYQFVIPDERLWNAFKKKKAKETMPDGEPPSIPEKLFQLIRRYVEEE